MKISFFFELILDLYRIRRTLTQCGKLMRLLPKRLCQGWLALTRRVLLIDQPIKENRVSGLSKCKRHVELVEVFN